LKKEVFDLIKKDIKYLALIFLSAVIIFKIVFFNDSLIVLLRSVLSLFWLFALPGYFLTLYWNGKLSFTERFVIGIALSAVIIGVFSYYLGLMGLNIKYHTILLPSILILNGLWINMRK